MEILTITCCFQWGWWVNLYKNRLRSSRYNRRISLHYLAHRVSLFALYLNLRKKLCNVYSYCANGLNNVTFARIFALFNGHEHFWFAQAMYGQSMRMEVFLYFYVTQLQICSTFIITLFFFFFWLCTSHWFLCEFLVVKLSKFLTNVFTKDLMIAYKQYHRNMWQ